MKNLYVKLRAGVVLGISDNFERYIMKIYTSKTQWKDKGRPIKNIATMQQQDISS